MSGGVTVGRHEEIAVLIGHLDRLRRNEGGLVVIEGEAGVGKSHLLRHLADEAASAGCRVLVGAADEFDLGRPFAPLIAACAADAEIAAEVDLLLATGSDRATVAEGIGSAIERAALVAPVLLAVEDVHWASADTVYALAALRRRHAALLLVVTARPYPRSAELARVLTRMVEHGAGHLQLEALDVEAQRELVTALAGAPPGPELAQTVEAAGGNPLLITQLVQALREEHRLVERDGRLDVDGFAVPATLRASVRSRLGGLPPSTGEALRAAAVLGRTFTPADVAGILGRDGVAVLRDLDPALAAGLLEEEGPLLAFRHDLLRAAVYEDTPVAFRVELHRAAAEAIRRRNGRLPLVAHHLSKASEPGDTAAVDLLVEAAEELSRRAPGEAVDLLERAASLADAASRPDQSTRIDARLALPLAWLGRVDEAAARAEAALARGASASDERAALLGLARARLMQGRVGEGRLSLERLANGAAADDAEAAELLAEAALVRLLAGDGAGAATAAAEARRRGDETGNLAAVALALCTDALRADLAGRYEDAVMLARNACDLVAGREGHQPHYILALIEVDADRLDAVPATLAAGLTAKQREGTAWDRPLFHSLAAHAHFLTGAWDDALAELEVARDVAAEGGSRVGMAWSCGLRSIISLRRGDRAGAEDALAEARDELARSGPQFGAEWALAAEALVAEADGDVTTAVARAGLAWDIDRSLGIVTELRLLGPLVVRTALAAGDPQRAAAVADDFVDVASTTKLASDEGAALRCRGLASSRTADLLAAVEALRRSPRAVELAEAAEDAAVALAQSGERQSAVALADEALAIYERAGASHDTARTLARLRDAGIRRGARGTRRRASTGPSSLTPTEVRVVRLVREGLTNDDIAARLFVSRRTVETHLTHIFTKLGVRTRRDLPPV